jgi:hypothetical protein
MYIILYIIIYIIIWAYYYRILIQSIPYSGTGKINAQTRISALESYVCLTLPNSFLFLILTINWIYTLHICIYALCAYTNMHIHPT